MTALASRHCQPVKGAPLAAHELPALLSQVPAWAVVDGALQRQVRIDDWPRLMSFVNAVAWLAQTEDHHPELQIAWGRCTLRWHTHSVGGLSVNDFICAARVDALLPTSA